MCSRRAPGLAEQVEDASTCCYATQDKVWSSDPQGMRWEWYRVLEDSDSETFGKRPEIPEAKQQAPAPTGGCCA